MRTTSVLRVGAVLGILVLCGLMAAERRSPLIGSTRDQVRAKLGEPKSNIVAGPREVLIYPQERIVIRDGVVVEVDALYELSVAKPPTLPSTPVHADETKAGTPATGAAETNPGAPTATPSTKTESAEPAATESEPAPAPVQEVTIKSVRPPSRSAGNVGTTPPVVARPGPQASTTERSPRATLNPSSPGTPLPGSGSEARVSSEAAAAPKPAAAANTPPATVPAPVVTSAPVVPPALVAATAGEAPAGTLTTEAPAATAAQPAETPPAPSDPAAANAVGSPVPAEAPAANRTPLILGGLVLVLVGLLAWVLRQRRQRSLLLEATAVSHPPFATTPLVHAPASRFTLDLLQKLEWKRFEELVCAYYNKTGVLAVRTKAGRQNPVHVRISWKGEQRPFACVHCVAHAPMAVDQRPIEALHGALAIEDVRRGYVVTSGKFAPAARELAEEKQITLLQGEVFIEKLNALPDAARAELLKDVMTGDYATPSCPTCESKMAKSAADPLVWECAQCGTTLR